MTELMRDWLLGVTCAAMVMAVAETLTPEGVIRRICRLAGGVMLVLAAVNPVLMLDDGAISRALTDYRVTAEDYGAALVERNNLLYKTIIEEETAAYILDKAKEQGILCSVDVVFSYDGQGNPYPCRVTVLGQLTQLQQDRLSHLIETDLGVLPKYQRFERGET